MQALTASSTMLQGKALTARPARAPRASRACRVSAYITEQDKPPVAGSEGGKDKIRVGINGERGVEGQTRPVCARRRPRRGVGHARGRDQGGWSCQRAAAGHHR